MIIKTQAVVVREKTIGRDRAIWFLTEKLGTVNVYLKGAAATRSKFAPCTQLFCLSEINLFQNKESYSLNTCDVINSFFSLRENLEALSLASYFSEVTMDTAPDNEEAGEYFSLLLNCFFLIQQGKKDLKLIKSVFEMRIMTLSGFLPDILLCEKCGDALDGDIYFSLKHGTAICSKCCDNKGGRFFLPASVLYALRHICYSESKKIFSFDITLEALTELSNFTEQYLIFQLGRSFGTLDFFKSL